MLKNLVIKCEQILNMQVYLGGSIEERGHAPTSDSKANFKVRCCKTRAGVAVLPVIPIVLAISGFTLMPHLM